MSFFRYVKLTIAITTTALGITFPLLACWDYVSPWNAAVTMTMSRNPGQLWIPIGGGRSLSSENGKTTHDLRWRRFVLLPVNKTVTVKQEFGAEIEYDESPGGLFELVIGFCFLYGLWAWIGLPEIQSWIRERAQP